MHTKRIIPCLDVHNGRVVKGVNFINHADAGDPVEAASFYNNELADELVFLDITASSDARNIMADVVARAAERIFIPLTVGGGIRTIDDVRYILKSGADKVSINSAAIDNPNVINEAADKFGSSTVVVAIDCKRRQTERSNESAAGKHQCHYPNDDADYRQIGDHQSGGCRYEVYKHGGRLGTGIDALEWAIEAEKRGAGEILLTSMNTDGVKTGYDLDITRQIAQAVSIPVIASGGAGAREHFYDALTVGGADAALAASLFHYRELSIIQVKQYLLSRNIPVRI
ncbi:MAG: imidazole glycerol phosphate synthase subunit HisF [Clostridiales bacterium]|jgi:cyclase|nr:imidazole glycerol phosphate synthase subunit HisF [Clostridiales bacterium]